MTDPSVTSRFDEILRDLLGRSTVRQAIAAVWSPGRSIDWTGIGAAEGLGGEALRPDTPFFIASIDKLFNATLVLLLGERGLLDLDATVVSLLPGDEVHGLHVLQGIDHTSEITVRHLLTHTSGLPDWLEDAPRGEKSLVDTLVDGGDQPFTFERFAHEVSERLTPHFPPQDLSGKRPRIRYSDTNFILLIRIIEAVTGQPLPEVHRRLLYEPLGLEHTYFPGRSEPLEPTPPPMPLLAGGERMEIPHLMAFIRGINSTTGDMMAFMRGLTAGAVFQHPETLASMTRTWRRFGFPLDPAAMRAPSWPMEYGLGIMRFQLPRLFTALRRLPPVLGHTGSTGCWLFWCREYDVYLAGSVNEASAAPVPFRAVPAFLQVIRDHMG